MTAKSNLKIINTIAFLLMVTVNVLANTIPIGGFNTGQISAMYPTLITPPGWTFTIWAVIYALLAVVVGRQLIDKRYNDSLTVGPYLFISCILNTAWIFAWHTQHMVIASIIILALFAVLLKLYTLTRKSDVLTRSAFGIYYAWITVASVIMIFATVKALTGHAPISPIVPRSGVSEAIPAPAGESFTGIVLISGTPEIVSYVTLSEYIMAIIALIILTLIVVLHILLFEDIAYIAVIIWALGGIAVRQLTSITPPVIFLIVCAASICTIAYFIIKQGQTKPVGKEILYENS